MLYNIHQSGGVYDVHITGETHRTYTEHSRYVMELLRDSAPLVEQLSIDEAFLDVSDDSRSGEQIAAALQAEINQRFSPRPPPGGRRAAS